MDTVGGTPAGLAGCQARGGVAGGAGGGADGAETAAGVGRASGDGGDVTGAAAGGGGALGVFGGERPCGVLGASFEGEPGRALGEGEPPEFILIVVTAEKGCVGGLAGGRAVPVTEMVVPRACRGSSGAGGIFGGSARVSSGDASGGRSERKRRVSCESLGDGAMGRIGTGRDVVTARSSVIDGGRA